MINLSKTYNPSEFESKLYKQWSDGGYFKAGEDDACGSFSIVLPPPNITGQLHMGHALDHTLQDILIRYNRMKGKSTLWQPGTDHASIATEVKVVEKVKNKYGKSKEELGREKFLEEAWLWKEEFGGKIVEQMKKLGDSCDWSRQRFTMDEGLSEAVMEYFVRLYEKGFIYRGNRIINWCPNCKTSLSDAEVEHEETDGHFYNIKYMIDGTNDYIEVATTRPETILGDTAVAVHPEDKRYTDLIGKTVLVPIVNRKVSVIADDYVDMEFGTGAVKITPCHDPNDFEVGKRHNLAQILVIDEHGNMNENAGKYQGLDRFECRKQICEDMKNAGLLISVKEHKHNVGHCYRCHTIVEPVTSKQWFVKMSELAKPAIEAIKDGRLTFVPRRFNNTYISWLENIRDWNISRQLWWGHRIPAYYCDDCGEITVAGTMPETCPKCGSDQLHQDEDVLDTWFSSALWPLSTLGWLDDSEYFHRFFPTSVLVTGYDIIFFWVVRMAFTSLFLKNEVPFKTVLIHGLVRDSLGRKMSKSLGNGINPLDVIDSYGADALRFSLISGNTPGNDMRFYDERVLAARNFANKLWNSARFMLMNLEEEDLTIKLADVRDNLELSDRWILSKLNHAIKQVDEYMDKLELGAALDSIYDFTWNSYCDWYIELIKKRLYIEEKTMSKKAALFTGLYVLKNILKLLHPFMPFVTEEIWSNLGEEQMLIISKWSEYNAAFAFEAEEKAGDYAINAIIKLRNLRAESHIPQSKKSKVYAECLNEEAKKIINMTKEIFMLVGNATELVFIDENQKIENSLSLILDNAKLYLPSSELIDLQKEIKRLKEEEIKILSEIDRADKKLKNEKFVAKAPAKLVEEEKEKLSKYKTMLVTIREQLNKYESKQ